MAEDLNTVKQIQVTERRIWTGHRHLSSWNLSKATASILNTVSLLAGSLWVFLSRKTPENAEFAIADAILDARLITCTVCTRYRAPGYTENSSCTTRSRGILQRGRYWINTNAELVFSKLSYDRCTFFCLNFIELIIEGSEGCRFPHFLVLLYKVLLALASSLQTFVVKNVVWCIDILWFVPLVATSRTMQTVGIWRIFWRKMKRKLVALLEIGDNCEFLIWRHMATYESHVHTARPWTKMVSIFSRFSVLQRDTENEGLNQIETKKSVKQPAMHMDYLSALISNAISIRTNRWTWDNAVVKI